MIRRRAKWAAAAFCFFLTAKFSWARGPFNEGRIFIGDIYSTRLLMEGSTFINDGYFNDGGVSVKKSSNHSYQSTEYQLGIGHWIDRRIELIGLVGYRKNQSEDGNVANDVSGPESIQVGARLAREFLYPDLLFQLDYLAGLSLYTNENQAQNFVLGDGGQTHTLGATLQKTWIPNLIVMGRLFGSYHTTISNELGYELGIGPDYRIWRALFFLKKSFALGEARTRLDPNASLALNQLYHTNGREMTSLGLKLNALWNEDYRFQFSYESIIEGRSFDRGHLFAISFTWVFGQGLHGTAYRYNAYAREEYLPKSEELQRNSELDYLLYKNSVIATYEAKVIKISPRGIYVVIDKGSKSDMVAGLEVVLLKKNLYGEKKILGKGQIAEVDENESTVKVIKKLKNVELEIGTAVEIHFTGRR